MIGDPGPVGESQSLDLRSVVPADLQFIDSGFGEGALVTVTPDNAWVGGMRLGLVL